VLPWYAAPGQSATLNRRRPWSLASDFDAALIRGLPPVDRNPFYAYNLRYA
jgi:hypothetical protein